MSQVQKRVSMSEKKKKIAAEKRKAKMEAENQARIEDYRTQKIANFYDQIKGAHEKKTAELDAAEAKIKKERAMEEAWVQRSMAIHEKYCKALTSTRLGTELYAAIIRTNEKMVTAIVHQADEGDHALFDSIKDVKNIKYAPCCDPYASHTMNHWRVTFEIDP